MHRLLLVLSVLCLAGQEPPRSMPPAGDAPEKPGSAAARAQAPANKRLEDVTAGMRRWEGYFPLYWDAARGRLLLEIRPWNTEFLYQDWLATGVGSNEVGLDRGQPGRTRVVRFERYGPRALLVQSNYNYRAESSNPEERRAAEEAFARSVLWGFDIEAEGSDGRALVDASKFFLQDAHDVAGAIKRAKGGNYQLDASRSALVLGRTKNFPRNTEVEALLTFTGEPAGTVLRSVAPDARALSVQVHHSLIRLPDPGYRPRAYDPRSGYFALEYMDFAVPLGEPLTRRFIERHRLRKKDPKAARSAPVEPIVYYVDRGAPEPIRRALVEGAQWWNQAFEAAGYDHAFQVKLLPEGADPMDVRYNVIQWVHRSTRGWAYGSAITDPRTGEIIKGHVTMDSQRARQVYRILEGLLASYEKGQPVDPRIEQTVLARMRQLSAHEVGHTLGLAHNFAASATGRASVMDYPPPVVTLKDDGSLDVSHAYATGIGAWDKVSIAYGYQDFPAGTDERQALDDILSRSIQAGLIYLTDEDARPPGSAHPQAHLWDNGASAVDELERVLKVRQRALARLSEKNVPFGRPLSGLEEQLVLVYLFHRYQAEAAAKVVGGLDYRFAVRGDGQKVTEIVPAVQQRKALEALLGTLRPDFLTLPESLWRTLPPPASGYPRTREAFAGRTGLAFDALAAAETAADLVVRLLLDPERAERLIEQHARDVQNPGLPEILDQLLAVTWKAAPERGVQAEIQRVVNEVVLERLLALAGNEQAAAQARAVVFLKLQELDRLFTEQLRTRLDESRRAALTFAQARIRRFLREPGSAQAPHPLEAPPGQPIGCGP